MEREAEVHGPVTIAGQMMLMPGLPKSPQASRIDMTDDGEIVGLR